MLIPTLMHKMTENHISDSVSGNPVSAVGDPCLVMNKTSNGFRPHSVIACKKPIAQLVTLGQSISKLGQTRVLLYIFG